MKTLTEVWKTTLSRPLTLARLNGELIPQFKAISKSDPGRSDVWLMVTEKAFELGFEFDMAKLEFFIPAAPQRIHPSPDD